MNVKGKRVQVGCSPARFCPLGSGLACVAESCKCPFFPCRPSPLSQWEQEKVVELARQLQEGAARLWALRAEVRTLASGVVGLKA